MTANEKRRATMLKRWADPAYREQQIARLYVSAQESYFLRRKLTMRQARKVRELLDQGVIQRTIAKRYGVSQTVISFIKRGLTYRDPA